MTNNDGACSDPNRYTVLWSAKPGDYYADTIELINDGPAFRICVGGRVMCRTLRQLIDMGWAEKSRSPIHEFEAEMEARQEAAFEKSLNKD